MTNSNVKPPTDDGNIIHDTKPGPSDAPVIPLDGSSDVPATGNIYTPDDAGGVTEIISVG